MSPVVNPLLTFWPYTLLIETSEDRTMINLAAVKERYSVQCSRVGQSKDVAPWYTVAQVFQESAAHALACRYVRLGETVRVYDDQTGKSKLYV